MNANFNLYVGSADFKTFEQFHETYGRQTSKTIMSLIESHMNEVKKDEKRQKA